MKEESRFLTDSDYLTVIDSQALSVVKGEGTAVQLAEDRAVELIAGYLRNRYDVEEIFACRGTDRNVAVVSWAVDIALYNMHSRLPGRMAGELRKERYDLVIAELESISKGQVTPDLPLIDYSDTGNPIKWGSQKQYNNRW
jgi:phage gp36-like protein